MNTPTSPQAGIIGAGIAGLSAAIALRRAGWDVEIFEKSHFKNEVGAAMTIPPNATRVLQHWGFDFQKAGAVPCQSRRFLSGVNLESLDSEDFPDIAKDLGAPAWTVHRVDLHQALRNLALIADDGASQQVKLQLGQHVTEIDAEKGILTLSNEIVVKKDLIIVADGVHSEIAKQVNPLASEIHRTGRSVYRCLIPTDRLKVDPEIWSIYENQVPGFVAFLSLEPNVLFMTYGCRDNTIMNVAVVHDTHPGEGDENLWHAPAKKDDIMKDIAAFHPCVKKILKAANDKDIAVHHQWSRKPLNSFVNGKAIAMGDAAHAMLPTHAAGGALAIESAAFLEVLFKDINHGDNTTIQRRIHLFDSLRLPRCNLTMILSNNGHRALYNPQTEQEIRKFYTGPLPSAEDSSSWGSHMRKFMFQYDAYKVAQEALARETS